MWIVWWMEAYSAKGALMDNEWSEGVIAGKDSRIWTSGESEGEGSGGGFRGRWVRDNERMF